MKYVSSATGVLESEREIALNNPLKWYLTLHKFIWLLKIKKLLSCSPYQHSAW